MTLHIKLISSLKDKYTDVVEVISVEEMSSDVEMSSEYAEHTSTYVAVVPASEVLETLYKFTRDLATVDSNFNNKFLPVFESLWEAQKADDAQASANDQTEADFSFSSNGDRANDQTMVDYSFCSNDDATLGKRQRDHQMDTGFSKTRKTMHQTGANSFSDSESGSFA